MLTLLAVTATLLLGAGGNEIDQHVVNGVVANSHQYPWQLSLQRDGHHICGAVLIDELWALTAAHCVNTAYLTSYRVKCGAHNIHATESHRQAIRLDDIIIHPNYNPNGQRPAFPNDIALLRLRDVPDKTGHECGKAILPHNTNDDFGDRKGVITGWGRLSGGGALPSELKEGDIDVLTPQECANRWGSYVSSSIHVCVKDLGDQVFGACNGDSGGPAHAGNTVIGLASFVANGCLTSYPSVYVRVSNYLDWIQGVTGL